jgi:two-component system, sensor histidine kinase and response regulator
VKFTERGEIHVRAELLERTGEKVKLQFCVRDTGVGMTHGQAAKLFQPFTQADMSTTRKHGGTGLGLTICRRLVELMGGQIWLESEPGVGSAFFFTVWLGIGAARGPKKIVPERLGTLRALVVDDNPAAREILVHALQDITGQVDAVASGPEAIAAVKQDDVATPIDVVFMDWRMPGMSGLQAVRLIREDGQIHRQPAVVIVTAFGREEVREEAENLNIDGFLVKPVTRSMLVDTLVTIFAPVAGEETQGAAREEPSSGLEGARILLAEDNEINQQIAVELLAGYGAQVEVAENGLEAVERLTQGPYPPPFDLVLMDIQMPEMDGYQATTRIRSDARFGEWPIIAMTAHATVEERQKCLAAGMNDHITKPIDPTALYETLRRYYRKGAPEEAGGKPKQAAGEGASKAATATDGGGRIEVEGLNVEDGLRRVAGNAKLYRSLLRQFMEGQTDAAEKVARSLQGGDWAVAERTAHTVKGVAGNIGATEVQGMAGELEKAIRQKRGAEEIEALRARLDRALGELKRSLEAALGRESQPATTAAVSSAMAPEEVKATVQKLLGLLAESDAESVEVFESARAMLRGLFAPEDYARFERNMASYAFGEAYEDLRKVAGNLGV